MEWNFSSAKGVAPWSRAFPKQALLGLALCGGGGEAAGGGCAYFGNAMFVGCYLALKHLKYPTQ
jgi:hypothetical protein